MAAIDWLESESAALDVASALVARAKAAGADVAEAAFFYNREVGLTYRAGEVSDLGRSEDLGLNLRVWVGAKVATLSGNQMDAAALGLLAEQAVARARHLPDSPEVDLPTVPDAPRGVLEVDLAEPSLETLKAQAQELYEGAMAVAGIVNSDGGNAGWSRARTALVASNGLAVTDCSSRYSRGISVQAGKGADQTRGYDSCTRTHVADLKDLSSLVTRATERALAQVGARPVASFQGDVVFDAPMAKSLFAGMLGAINGSAIAKGQSFLKEALLSQIFPANVQILDDPSVPRGLGSRRLDREGHAPSPLTLVRDGTLQHWLLDRRSARKLGLQTNARAGYSGGGTLTPSASNVRVSGGHGGQDDLIAGVDRGLLVTQMMGAGLNPLTGDYSRGAAGFLIEKGKLTQPVQAMTVAGQMQRMFADLHLAADTDGDGTLAVPSVHIPQLAIAGMA